MSDLLVGLVSALLATNQPAAISNLVAEKIGISVEMPNPDDPVEKEFRALLELDDAAQTEVDKWIIENNKFAQEGAGVPAEELNERIHKRFEPVRKAYTEFIEKHPKHAGARLAFASFLSDTGDEHDSLEHMEKARELDADNPAVWNNLANYYGHYGEVKKSFDYYAKAIELNPNEPIYYHNFGTTVFLFRKDAREFYNINEQQVFDKAMDLYSHALKLDPDNFPLATDVAATYYGIRPLRTNDALTAWTNALNKANSQAEREGVYIHLARVKMMAGWYDEAKAQLTAVTNRNYADLRDRVGRAIERHIAEGNTNSPATQE